LPFGPTLAASIVPHAKRKHLLLPTPASSSGIDYDDPIPLDLTDDDEFAEQEFEKASSKKGKAGAKKEGKTAGGGEGGDGKKRGRPKKEGAGPLKRQKSEGRKREGGMKQTKLVQDREEDEGGEPSSDDVGFDIKQASKKKSLNRTSLLPFPFGIDRSFLTRPARANAASPLLRQAKPKDQERT
jgi:hypothetical protein